MEEVGKCPAFTFWRSPLDRPGSTAGFTSNYECRHDTPTHPLQAPLLYLCRLFLLPLLILMLGACGGSRDANTASVDLVTANPKVMEHTLSDAGVGGETEDATEAAILEAAKRSVEEAAAKLEAALTYLTQLLGDQTPQQSAPDAVENNPALQAPVTRSLDTFAGETIHTTSVGIQGPHVLGTRHDGLDRLSDRDGVIVSYGTLVEGYDRLDVIAYLLAFESPTYPGVSTFAEPPVVRLAEGTSAEFMDHTLHAVQQINAALPPVARMQISDTPSPPRSNTVPDGQIFVDFIESKADWPNDPAQLGTATGNDHARPKTSAHVWLNVEFIREAAAQLAVFKPEVTIERALLHMITHELLHALGFDGGHANPDLYPYSIMHTSPILTQFGTTQGNLLMHWVDMEALAAAYGALSPGDSALSLGVWDRQAVRVHGDIVIGDRWPDYLPSRAHVSFGTAHRNGLSQPWAIGPTPAMDLAANRGLQGSAMWSGHLLGFTPDVEVVAGSAELGMNLATLRGSLAFTGLEWWAQGESPGDAGTGQRWGDSELAYEVSVHGSTFMQTGGDVGIVTGVFFGNTHEAMGGTLEQDDLTAAFGGKR